MKVAIHHRKNSFSTYWIEYCKRNSIDYKIVDAFDNDIIKTVEDCDVFMWHHHHSIDKDIFVANKVLYALEHSGVKVFPDFKTSWHFDDKISQKYLCESTNIPSVPSYVFYDKRAALKWAKTTSYPKVFKLRNGAGATNVKLVKSYAQAKKLIKKSFGKGISRFNKTDNILDTIYTSSRTKSSFIKTSKSIARTIVNPNNSKESGYVYFQDYIPNNDSDTRVVVINGKYAAAEKRFVRKNDFRASGSGLFSYSDIDPNVIKVAFDIANKLKLQCVAFDFIKSENNLPLLIEMSYGFGTAGILSVPGFWDNEMRWFEEEFKPHDWLMQEIIEDIRVNKVNNNEN